VYFKKAKGSKAEGTCMLCNNHTGVPLTAKALNLKQKFSLEYFTNSCSKIWKQYYYKEKTKIGKNTILNVNCQWWAAETTAIIRGTFSQMIDCKTRKL